MPTNTNCKQSKLNIMNNQINSITVYFGNKFNKQPLCGAMNLMPDNKGQKMNFWRGTCLNDRPFKFQSIELALDGFLRASRKLKNAKVMVFQKNKCIGHIVNGEFRELTVAD